MRKHCTAIALSAGQGRRMGASVQKQYMELGGRPVIYYALKTFEDSGVIDDIILVVGKGQEEDVRCRIVEKYGITKVRAIVSGGKERYDSVWRGLQAMTRQDGYVFIHDGARPFVDEAMLRRGYETVEKYGACVAGMPSKDTVKLADDAGIARETPERKYVWAVQTPQIFETPLITEAYSRLLGKKGGLSEEGRQEQACATGGRDWRINVTDDAMVAEQMMNAKVKLFEGSYENIKITTPEDIDIARMFLRRKSENIENVGD